MKMLINSVITICIVTFTGCGEDDNSKQDGNISSSILSSSSNDNSSFSSSSEVASFSSQSSETTSSTPSSNNLGYFGSGVFFGDKELIGRWEHEIGYITFNKDGNASHDIYGSYRNIYIYGVSTDGNVLKESNSELNYQYTFMDSNETCITALLSGSHTEEHETFLCRSEVAAPSFEAVDNTMYTQNETGYFGDGVLFGNLPAIGTWVYVPVEGGSSTTLTLHSDGSGTLNYYPQTSGFPLGEYGISSDGRTLSINNAPAYKLIDTYEECYLMQDEKNKTLYKMCHMDYM